MSQAVKTAAQVRAETVAGKGLRTLPGNSRFAAGGKHGKAGVREDLENTYLRSMWEANFLRYVCMCIESGKPLNVAGSPPGAIPIDWQYEPRKFKLFGVNGKQYDGGCRVYIPDFRIQFQDGSFLWFEVKGWMDDKSWTKISRFMRCYPKEPIKIVGPKTMKQLAKSYSLVIPGWESQS